MSKEIIYGSTAKQTIKEGIDAVANAVKVTLGPKGQNVLIDEPWNEGKVTKDGVSVAKAIELNDKVRNAGAKIVKKVASKTAEDAGDGTTTATVLAQAIVEEGTKLIATGVNPMDLKKGIDLAVAKSVAYFKSQSVPVTDESTLKSISTISANGDVELGDLVGNVIDQIGKDGVVTIETSKSLETYIEKVHGLKFDKGYISPYFITDPNKMQCVLDNPVILITDQRISTVKQIQPVLEMCNMNNRSLLIIADDVDGEALQMLVVNRLRGTLRVCTVKCPAFGDRRIKELEDIAFVSGGTLISVDRGLHTDKVTNDQLGKCSKVVVDSKSCTIVDGEGAEDKITERLEQLNTELENAEGNYNKDIIKTRIARVKGGVAVLYVGAMTEVELNEKKDRIDDALCASKAAQEEGVLPGGGIAYINASRYLHDQFENADLSTGVIAGIKLVQSALQKPLTQIVDNGYGEGEGRVVVGNVLSSKNKVNFGTEFNPDTFGFNARTGEYGDMIKMQIIDPAKVCRTALENAASIAGMYLTTGCIVIDNPEDEKKDK